MVTQWQDIMGFQALKNTFLTQTGAWCHASKTKDKCQLIHELAKPTEFYFSLRLPRFAKIKVRSFSIAH